MCRRLYFVWLKSMSTPARYSTQDRKRISEVLQDVTTGSSDPHITMRQIALKLEDRGFGFLLLFIALPNLIPGGIPLISTILGLPLLWISVQMLLGMARPRFPGWIANRRMGRSGLKKVITKLVPMMQKLEKLLHPRLTWACHRGGERAAGIVVALLAIILILPIPLGNMLPAFMIVIIALGLIEHDGVVLLFGVICGLAVVALYAGVVGKILWHIGEYAVNLMGMIV
jgi:hypothetical protein